MDNFRESKYILHRLLAALAVAGIPDRGKVSKVAAATGYSVGQVSGLLSGKEPLNDRFKKAVCTAYSISEDYLDTGEGAMFRSSMTKAVHGADGMESHNSGGEFVNVPRYEIAASAGGGALVQSEQIVDYLAFKQDWLKTQLGLSPSHVAVISVIGDSMEPYLFDGDLIMVDTNVARVENDAIYVLQVGEALLVKRIQKKLDGTVIVKSDNERYEPDVFRGDSISQLRIVGRMVRRLVR